MRLKQKPKEPKRRTLSNEFSCSSETVASIVARLEEEGVLLENAVIEVTSDWDDYSYPEVHYSCEESDEHFNARMIEYKNKLGEWEFWYENNKEAIEAEKARRAAVKADKKAKKLKKLEEQKRKLEAEIKKLK